MKTVLKYPGAKNRIEEWICNYIPPHEVYVEPYFGSGTVFFNKRPARIETLNDLDGNVVNYFKVVREQPEELGRMLKLTPFARMNIMPLASCVKETVTLNGQGSLQYGVGRDSDAVTGNRTLQEQSEKYKPSHNKRMAESAGAADRSIRTAEKCADRKPASCRNHPAL